MAGHAFVFWLRRQGTFWMLALPIAGLGAAIAHVLETNQEFIDYRQHWVWNLLFALIYAMFFDRWIREVLLDGANDCDEVDELRRSMISPRFVAYILLLFGFAMALAQMHLLKIAVLPWLPEVIVWAPLSLGEAWSAGRASLVSLFLMIGGAALLSLLAASAATQAALYFFPGKLWAAAAITGASRLVDCLLLAFVGYGLAALFREHTGWQQPAPEEHNYRGVRARKA